MNYVASKSSFKVNKIEIGDFSINWTVGGRIIIKTLSTGETTFVEYSDSKIKKILEYATNSLKDTQQLELNGSCFHFNVEAIERVESNHFAIVEEEGSIYLLPLRSKIKGSWTISTSSSGSYSQVCVSKLGSIKTNSRYHLAEDGELSFIEEISIHNLYKRYQDAVVSVYAYRKKQA